MTYYFLDLAGTEDLFYCNRLCAVLCQSFCLNLVLNVGLRPSIAIN